MKLTLLFVLTLLEYMPVEDNKYKDLAFVGYTFKRFESLTKRDK